jgi:hypothetical protein
MAGWGRRLPEKGERKGVGCVWAGVLRERLVCVIGKGRGGSAVGGRWLGKRKNKNHQMGGRLLALKEMGFRVRVFFCVFS